MHKDDCLKQIVAQDNRPFRTKNRIAQTLVSLWEENLENEKTPAANKSSRRRSYNRMD
jgi:hypothetical protein